MGGYGNSFIYVADFQTGKALPSVGHEHPPGISALAFSPDSALLVASSGGVRIWDRTVVEGRDEHPSIAISADKNWLAVGVDEWRGPGQKKGSIELRSLPNGKLVRTLEAPAQAVRVHFSADGKRLFSCATTTRSRLDTGDGARNLQAAQLRRRHMGRHRRRRTIRRRQ